MGSFSYIILLHNHPDSSRPSWQDLKTYLQEDKVKISVVVGHNGDLYAIIGVNVGAEVIYNSLLNNYRKEFDEMSAKTLATNSLYSLNKNNRLMDVRRYSYDR